MMGFFRRQEEQVVVRILRARYATQGLAPPSDPELQQKASDIVQEAHRILRRRGGNLIDIVKGLVADWVKKG
jgi:hypothetical protein